MATTAEHACEDVDDGAGGKSGVLLLHDLPGLLIGWIMERWLLKQEALVHSFGCSGLTALLCWHA